MGNKKGMTRKELKARIKMGFAAVLAIFGVKVAVNLLDAPKEPDPIPIENEDKNFKDKYKVSQEELSQYKPVYPEKSASEQVVDSLKTKEEVLAFFKDMYIEQYEQVTGDSTLTTDDIKIIVSNTSYAFINEQTGEIVDQGNDLFETMQKIEGKGFESDTSIKDLYTVQKKGKNGEYEFLDCMTMRKVDGEYKAVSVTPGEYYGKEYEHISVFEESNDVKLGKKTELLMLLWDQIGVASEQDVEDTKQDILELFEETKIAEQEIEYF